MSRFKELLKGGDLRSIGKANTVVGQVKDQQDFDELFSELYNADRKVVMRAADAIEKISTNKPAYLQHHKAGILPLCKKARDIELKWHLALLLSRLHLTKSELDKVWKMLNGWATDKTESKIVRVNALQAMHDIQQNNEAFKKYFNQVLKNIEQENIPSLNARIRKLKHKD